MEKQTPPSFASEKRHVTAFKLFGSREREREREGRGKKESPMWIHEHVPRTLGVYAIPSYVPAMLPSIVPRNSELQARAK